MTHISKSDFRSMVRLMAWSSSFIDLHASKSAERNKARLIRNLAKKLSRHNAELLRDNGKVAENQ